MSEPLDHIIQTEKTYTISQMVITVRNQAIIQKSNNQQQKQTYLSDNSSHLQNNVIKKNLIFQFPNHIINIKDSIQISFLPKNKLESISLPQSPPSLSIGTQKNPQNKSENKKLILFKNKSKNSSETSARSNKKNIVKNVMSAFLNYFSGISGQNQQLHTQQLKKMINKSKYNNKLVRKLMQRNQLGVYFKRFLDEAALDWIKTSKIKDKDVHIQAINLYIKLYDQNQRKHNRAANTKNETQSIEEQDQQQEQQYNMFQQGLNHDLQHQMSKFK